jgi:hypothetical protein
MEEASLSPREKTARMKLSVAIQHVYDERWKDNKDGMKQKALEAWERKLTSIISGKQGKVNSFRRYCSIKAGHRRKPPWYRC